MLAVPGATAVAQPTTNVPGLSIRFLDPFAIGSPSASFDVVLRLALAAGSPTFSFNGTAPPAFGLPGSFPFPTTGNILIGPNAGNRSTFTRFTGAALDAGIESCGSFTDVGCNPGAYQFLFNTNAPTFVGLGELTLAPGTFMDFLLGTFVPTGGAAPPGVYTFFNTGAVVLFLGEDSHGNLLGENVSLVETCTNQDPTCAFTRVVGGVTSIPEPATLGLVGMGVALLGIVKRRRRNMA
jgi:hypothetical protein